MMEILHSFYEGYINGFYTMQTPLETVSAFMGNATWDIIHLWGLL